MKQSAVEWLVNEIKVARKLCDDSSMEMDIWHTLDVLIAKEEQAKEMEKKQQDNFAIGFAEWCLKNGLFTQFKITQRANKELLEIYKKEKGL
jgi:predicted secreted protein